MSYRNINLTTRKSSFILLTSCLLVFYPLLKGLTWSSSAGAHTFIEAFSTLAALMTGAFALYCHRKHANNLLLLISAALICAGILDGHHAAVTSKQLINYLPSDLSALTPWSWLISRIFLSIFFAVGCLSLKYEQLLPGKKIFNERAI